MPRRVVIVHDDPQFTKELVGRLAPDAVAIADPVTALDALTSARTIEFLITRLSFDDKQPIGLSLARVTRLSRPKVRVIFTGQPEYKEIARGLGDFLTEPVTPLAVGMIIEWLSAPILCADAQTPSARVAA